MWLKAACIGLSFVFVGILVATPVAAIFQQALANGIGAYWQAISSDQSRQAIVLSLLAAFVAVPLNTTFGIAAAWAIARFEFPGKATFSAIIDLPFSVSPVIAGLVFVLLFGGRGLFGEWLQEHNFRIIFAAPGIVLATVFVTFPFVARELIPFMQAQGAEEDEAAMSLGASGLQTLLRVTLPSIKWSLLYGMIHCAARAMGEFGAVAVVSGHIRGRTVTAPLQVEILFNDFQFTAAFAVASLLAAMGLVTLLLKILLEGRRADHGN
ncbi:MAG: sulfate ABC transporter permease subunit CysW [Leptospirales bacterium]|nr:sulfate ABC transporter permease subunit CysW [Leptospirales bacterium]